MKGNKKVIDILNKLLASELTAIHQYVVHSEMAGNWGYTKLDSYIALRARDEMKHAEKLIARIMFLEGLPIVDSLDKIMIGKTVPEMFDNDHESEIGAIKMYNDAIKICVECADNTSRELCEENLEEEEFHADKIESNLVQINQMTLPVYLTQQV